MEGTWTCTRESVGEERKGSEKRGSERQRRFIVRSRWSGTWERNKKDRETVSGPLVVDACCALKPYVPNTRGRMYP